MKALQHFILCLQCCYYVLRSCFLRKTSGHNALCQVTNCSLHNYSCFLLTDLSIPTRFMSGQGLACVGGLESAYSQGQWIGISTLTFCSNLFSHSLEMSSRILIASWRITTPSTVPTTPKTSCRATASIGGELPQNLRT